MGIYNPPNLANYQGNLSCNDFVANGTSVVNGAATFQDNATFNGHVALQGDSVSISCPLLYNNIPTVDQNDSATLWRDAGAANVIKRST